MKQKSVVDRLVKLGMLTGLSIILVYVIHFPIFPAASFLEYDMADVPILIGTFLYGPWWGLALTAVVSLLQWLLVSPQSLWVGAVMHFCATGSYVIAAGLIYGKMRSLKGALIGMAVGAVLQTAMMIPMNLIFTVHFFGVPKETVLALLPTAIIPFNAIKTVANSVLTFLLYKRVEKLLKIEFIKSVPKQPPQPELEETKDPVSKP
ncbi:MAG: ECF transporter S component [Clostridiaceae bacterium]